MRALITGASGEIGGAVARHLAKHGYDLIVHYNSVFPEELLSSLRIYGIDIDPFRADLSKSEETERLAGFALEKGTDILINNAGISIVDVFQNVGKEDAERLLAVNTAAPIRLTQLLLPPMLRKGDGAIVNVSSIWGVRGASCEVHYSASKAALIGFSKALSKELENTGVTVNCIAPGFVDTKMNSHLSDEERDEFLGETPLGRAITPSEIAETVLSLIRGSESGKTVIME